MQTFLDQPEATFYHVTTIENWEKIKDEGLKQNSGKLFVSRIGELPVLLAIAFEQLEDIYNTGEIVFLKLPQIKNNFIVTEIKPDNQANEWTSPFQNIILRDHIPIENIELMMTIKKEKESMTEVPQITVSNTYLTRIACSGQECYKNHSITNRTKEIIY